METIAPILNDDDPDQAAIARAYLRRRLLHLQHERRALTRHRETIADALAAIEAEAAAVECALAGEVAA